MKIEHLDFGNYYHIFNRGNNGVAIFFEQKNYFYFLKLYEKYIDPVADTFAWCLMKNHFHFLVRLRELNEIHIGNLTYSTIDKAKKNNPSNQFSHFFNSYTQAINKEYNRTGSLLEKPFERKLVSSEDYLKKLVYYIHKNPVHHKLVQKTKDYKWSSYHSIISKKPTKLKRNEVIDWFDSVGNFISYHNKDIDIQDVL